MPLWVLQLETALKNFITVSLRAHYGLIQQIQTTHRQLGVFSRDPAHQFSAHTWVVLTKRKELQSGSPHAGQHSLPLGFTGGKSRGLPSSTWDPAPGMGKHICGGTGSKAGSARWSPTEAGTTPGGVDKHLTSGAMQIRHREEWRVSYLSKYYRIYCDCSTHHYSCKV